MNTCSIQYQEYIGQNFNRLHIIDIEKGNKDNSYRAVATCKCNCGTIKKMEFRKVKKGHTKSCGCLARETAARMIMKNRRRAPRKDEIVFPAIPEESLIIKLRKFRNRVFKNIKQFGLGQLCRRF